MKSHPNLLFWLAVLLLLSPAASIYASIPCLYLDKVVLWSPTDPTKTQGTLYSTSLTWRSALPGLHSWAVTPYAYRISNAYKALSYEAQLQSMTTTGGQLDFILYGSMGQITTISFTVMVVTGANTYFELLVTEMAAGTAGSSTATTTTTVTPTIAVTPSHRALVYYQWIKLYSTTITYFHIFSYATLSGGDFQISLWRNLPNYIERVKFIVVLLEHQNTVPNMALYYYFSWGGVDRYEFISSDFGVPSIYGSPATGNNCIIGFNQLLIHVVTAPNYFQYTQSGSTITGLAWSNSHKQTSEIVMCFVECPLSTYTNMTLTDCLPCNSSLPFCIECASDSVCLVCEPSVSYLSGTQCFPCNQSISSCLQCLNESVCTKCEPTSILLPDGSACPYCSSYMPNCLNCPVFFSCTMCSDTFFLGSDNTTCLLCADYMQGCWTCFSSLFCTRCHNVTLFISPDKTECLVCSEHLPNCLTCDSQSLCFSCIDQSFYLSANKTECLACFQVIPNCLTCLSQTVCLSCHNFTVLSLHNQCLSCSDLIPNCLACSSASYCDLCQLFTVVTPDRQSCQFCRNFMQYCDICTSTNTCLRCLLGIPVLGGCALDRNCLQVIQIPGQYSLVAKCIACAPGLVLSPEGKCLCQGQQLMVGYYCTSVVGCVSTQKVSGIAKCTFCDPKGGFLFNKTNNTCYCESGFHVANRICTDICGDGRVYTLKCDDGNTEDGDGCSAECQVEVDYRCEHNSTGQISLCRYIGFQINASLTKIVKKGDQNMGIFSFTLNPDQSSLSKFNISEYFKLECSDVILGGVSWSVSNGTITAEVEYLTDMEGRQCTATLAFNQLYIPYPPIEVTFKAVSSTAALIFMQSTFITEVISDMYLGISVAALLILFLGSWVHKMVGVELMHTLQLIYYLHFAFKIYTPNVGSVQHLSLVSMDHLFYSSAQSIRFYEEYQLVPFSLDYSERNLVIYMAVAGVIFAVWMVLFICSRLTQKQENRQISANTQTPEVVMKLYNSFVFPFILGFMVTFFFLRSTIFYDQPSSLLSFSLEPLSFFSSLAYFVTASVFFGELRHFHVKFDEHTQWKKFSLAHQTYIPVYQFFLFVTILTIQLGLVMGYHWFIYVVASLVAVALIMQIWLRPYYYSFDNISIVINSITLAVYLILLIAVKLGKLDINQNNQTVFAVLIVFLCMVCVLCSGIRIVIVLCRSCMKQPQPQVEEKENQKAQKVAKKKKIVLTKDEVTLKTMIEYYAASNANNKVILDEQGRFNQRRFPNARANNLKEDEERKAIIARMREQFRNKKMRQNERHLIREELEF